MSNIFHKTENYCQKYLSSLIQNVTLLRFYVLRYPVLRFLRFFRHVIFAATSYKGVGSVSKEELYLNKDYRRS